MPTEIKCPNCGHQFEPNDAIRDEVEKELRSKAADWQKKKNEEFQVRLDEERRKVQQSVEESLRKNITADFENQLRLLEQNNKDNEEKLRDSRKKEAEFMRKEQDLKTREAEIDLNVQRQIQIEREKLNRETEQKLKDARQKEAEYMRKEQDLINREAEIDINVQKQLHHARERMSEDIRKIEEQKIAAKETDYQLRLKELEKQLEDQKKLADEMRRRAEQGSIQTQGEVQELALEEMLRIAFPFDEISEVGKGVRGADCIQTVRNSSGQECGRIIFESKRTKEFVNDWLEKLKSDMRSQSADVAVLVTQTFPKDMDRFGERGGVWICSFAEVRAIVQMLRDGIIRVSMALKTQDNKGDKMVMLYNYLTSGEFAEQWKAIREGFMSMKISIQRERDAMERLWKQREKQLEKVLLNAAHIRGSVEGISGMDAVDLNLLDTPDNEDDMAH